MDSSAAESSYKVYRGLRQRSDYQAHNLKDGGSNPSPATKIRAVNSVGRVPALHAGCRRFEPVTAHQISGQVAERRCAGLQTRYR